MSKSRASRPRKTTQKSSLRLVDDLREKLGSWDKVAKSLGVNTRSIRRWREGTRNPDKGKFKEIIRKTAKRKRIRLTEPITAPSPIPAPIPTPTPPPSAPPHIDFNLLNVSFYWELADYPTWIFRCSKDLWFVSKIIPANLPDIQGGTLIDYQDYFAPFVNYINGMKSLSGKTKSDEITWLVTCTEPYFNEEANRWESEILSMDDNGNPVDYGFEPTTPMMLATKVIESDGQKPAPEPVKSEPEPAPEPSKPSDESERVKEIRGLIADLRQDVKDGLLTKDEYSRLVSELTAKMSGGGKV